MCMYCLLADWMHQYTVSPLPSLVQPWSPWNKIPSPVLQPQPWTRDQYDQAVKILQSVKEMEHKLGGCPCEDPSKMDFLRQIEERLNSERKADGSACEDCPVSE